MNLPYFVAVVLIPVVTVVLDMVWKKYLSKLVGLNYDTIIKNIQGEDASYNNRGIIMAYIGLALGQIMFVISPLYSGASKWSGAIYGALFNIIVYGILNASKLAMFNKYSQDYKLISLLWGALLGGVMGGVTGLMVPSNGSSLDTSFNLDNL